MKCLPLPIGLFLLATIAVDLAVVAFQSQPGGYRSSATILSHAMLALFLSQIIATAVWLGIGPGALPLRAVAAFFILLEWNAAVDYAWNQYESPYGKQYVGPYGWSPNSFELAFVFSTLVALYVAAPLLTLRLFGLRLIRLSCNKTPTTAAEEPRPLQFSIRYMFGLMTALAIIMGMLQFVFLYGYRNSLASDRAVHWRATLQAMIGWFAVWVTLGNVRCFRVLLPNRARKHWVRAVACLVIIGLILLIGRNSSICQALNSYCYVFGNALSTLLDRFYFPSHPYANHFNGIFCGVGLSAPALLSLEAFLLLGTLWMFRRAGYRVTFRANVTAGRLTGR